MCFDFKNIISVLNIGEHWFITDFKTATRNNTREIPRYIFTIFTIILFIFIFF